MILTLFSCINIKKKPSEFNQTATICLNGQEMQFVSHFLSSCINDAYYPITYRNNFQVKPSMVHRSIWAMRFGCRTLADKSGKKRGGIALVESIFVSHPVASAKLVTDTSPSPGSAATWITSPGATRGTRRWPPPTPLWICFT